VSNAIQGAFLSIGVYWYFWFMSFDPRLRVQVQPAFLGADASPEHTFDAAPSFLSLGALAWTCILWTVLLLGAHGCTFQVDCPLRGPDALGLMAAVLVSKIIFAPASVSHKRALIEIKGGKLMPSRSASLRLQDLVSSYIVNWPTTLFWKVVIFSLLGLILWLIGLSDKGTGLLLPLPIFIGWVFIYIGRMAAFGIALNENTKIGYRLLGIIDLSPTPEDQKAKWRKRIEGRLIWKPTKSAAIMVALFVSLSCMYIAVEALLKTCHGTGSQIPSVGAMTAGVFGPPIIEILILFAASWL
jgi:hypothetical protein